jgi:hypothetical protein
MFDGSTGSQDNPIRLLWVEVTRNQNCEIDISTDIY